MSKWEYNFWQKSLHLRVDFGRGLFRASGPDNQHARTALIRKPRASLIKVVSAPSLLSVPSFLVLDTVCCCAHPILSHSSFIVLHPCSRCAVKPLSVPLFNPSIHRHTKLVEIAVKYSPASVWFSASYFGRLILGRGKIHMCVEKAKACVWTKACSTVSKHTVRWTDAVCWANIDNRGV